MFHAKAVDRRRVVLPYIFLFRVESYPLANDGRLGAGGAPNRVGHFEANGENALEELVGTGAKSMFPMELVSADNTLMLRWDVASHVEALHDDGSVKLLASSGFWTMEGELGVRAVPEYHSAFRVLKMIYRL